MREEGKCRGPNRNPYHVNQTCAISKGGKKKRHCNMKTTERGDVSVILTYREKGDSVRLKPP